MLTVKNIKKKYGHFEAVKDVHFTINSGEIYGFLGPNGAGKTSTIKMCCGLLNPDFGEIIVNGVNLHKNPKEAKKYIGYVPDEPFLYDKLTGRQFIDFVGEIYGVAPSERMERMEYLLKLLDLSEKGNDLIGSYSRGMKRKVALIAGIIHKPKVLFLDEPTLGLDAISAKKSKDLIKEIAYKDGAAVLLTTHVMEIAEQICDRIAVISKGQIIAEGTLEALKSHSKNQGNLEDVFFELTQENQEPLVESETR